MPITLDSTLVTASAAALGSVVGAAATIATTWISQRNQAIREHFKWNLHERESLYGEFIKEASRLAVDALHHSLDEPEKLVALYGVLGRIRLLSGQQVLDEAEQCVQRIVELYSQPNLAPTEIRQALEEHKFDPVESFSSACRQELGELIPADQKPRVHLKGSKTCAWSHPVSRYKRNSN